MKNKCHIGWKTSNFSFSHNVFHSYISLVRQNAALCGNGLKAQLVLVTDFVEGNVNKRAKMALDRSPQPLRLP